MVERSDMQLLAGLGSGGTPESGADINAPIDLVDLNTTNVFKRGLNALADAAGAAPVFKVPPRRM